MPITTTTTLPAPVQQSFSYKLLSVPVPNMIHKIPAMLKTMPKNGGRTLRMRRYNPLATAMVPLGNTGVTPPSQPLTAVDIDATISFYGTYVQINEQVTLQSQDPVLNECAARLGVSLRQTEDQLTRDMLASTASVINCVAGVNGDTPTEITRADVDEVVRTLLNNNAYTVLDNIEGQDKFGTAPVRDAYFGLCSSQLTGNLDAVQGFIHKNNYPSPMNANRSEWGSIGNLRFLVSSIGSVTPTASMLGANVYNIFCVGMEAYACIEQDGYSAQFIYRKVCAVFKSLLIDLEALLGDRAQATFVAA
ncbi:N4-gp56 family major capsid protein [Candidatus Pacearchaeota archaeon]|jgi:N4-gp56 family major capsid protein|nr:N4-gp56 family major capsid protein [Candidatus Pacearchaeota archaeon]